MTKMTLSLPQDPRYHASLRLFFAGLGATEEATLEEIEDLKLLISEGMNLMTGDVTVSIALEGGAMEATLAGARAADEGLSRIIMESLADEVEIEEECVRFRKAFGARHE